MTLELSEKGVLLIIKRILGRKRYLRHVKYVGQILARTPKRGGQRHYHRVSHG